jgi:methylthioribose-1-phosphate isomerase
MSIANGDSIVIEERAEDEVTSPGGRRIAPPDVRVANPAFDVTPHELIAAIITERGIARAPYVDALREMNG